MLKRNETIVGSLALALVVVFLSIPVFASHVPPRKWPSSARDVSAIGHRTITCSEKCMGNFYSVEQEKKIGGLLSASLEKSTPILHDPVTAAYVDGIAQTIAQNSDTQMPITVRVIDSEKIYALTLPGGYQYVSRGLLLVLHGEGELASVLARGIAHTALRSATREATRASLIQAMTIPIIFDGQPPIISTSDSELAVPLMLLKFRRDAELAADYFGVQYVYKAGYDTNSFISSLNTVWAEDAISARSVAFSSFPGLALRLKAVEEEISEILPKRVGAVTTTPEFIAFKEHLLSLDLQKPEAKPQPTLLRPDPQAH